MSSGGVIGPVVTLNVRLQVGREMKEIKRII
jgi:hypothetical protein